MEVIIAKETLLSKLAEGLFKYPQMLVNLCVKEADKELIVSDTEVLEAVKKAEKMLEGKGRLLLRKSGTEPVIRIMAEAANEEQCLESIAQIRDVIERRGYISSNT